MAVSQDSIRYKKMVGAATESSQKMLDSNSKFFELFHNELWFDYNVNVVIINNMTRKCKVSQNLTQSITDIICLYSCNLNAKLFSAFLSLHDLSLSNDNNKHDSLYNGHLIFQSFLNNCKESKLFDVKKFINENVSNYYCFSDNYAPFMLSLPFKCVDTQIIFYKSNNVQSRIINIGKDYLNCKRRWVSNKRRNMIDENVDNVGSVDTILDSNVYYQISFDSAELKLPINDEIVSLKFFIKYPCVQELTLVCDNLKVSLSERYDAYEEQNPLTDSIRKMRRHQIDSAIIRIMKREKQLRHQDLVPKILQCVSNKFTSNEKDIKRRVETLIELEYLERSTHDRCVTKLNLYIYIYH